MAACISGPLVWCYASVLLLSDGISAFAKHDEASALLFCGVLMLRFGLNKTLRVEGFLSQIVSSTRYLFCSGRAVMNNWRERLHSIGLIFPSKNAGVTQFIHEIGLSSSLSSKRKN